MAIDTQMQRKRFLDDVLSGAEGVDAAIHLKNQLVGLLEGGGFHLRKWASNEPRILQDIPVHDRLRPAWRDFMNENPIQTLGVSWDSIADEFRFRTNLTSDRSMTTKRQVSSIIARLHDPMGWLAPVLLIAKVLMQSVWKSSISWDDPLPNELERSWSQFTVDLPNINKCSLPRWIGSTIAGISEQHGFADASKHAYAAAVYLVTQDHLGMRSSCLMIAKTKVAPIKTISIPRLELCAAVLLSRLLCRVMTELRNVLAATHARAREYLHTLQQRSKWTRKTTNLKEGDMVFILDPTLMRQHRWLLGTVTSVHPGADGFVRTATIRIASGIYDRPITKPALLPISQSQSSTE